MGLIHAIFGMVGFIAGFVAYGLLYLLSRRPRAEPTHIGDSTSGLGL